MKMNFVLLLLLFPLLSQAHTELTFFIGGRAMATISGVGPTGIVSDNDAADLFKLMNVPTQNTMLGPGKGIDTENQDFNFSCGTAPGRGPMCSVVFNSSERVHMQPSAKLLNYQMRGQEADAMSKKWFLQAGKMDYVSTDGLFKIHIEPGLFGLEVSGN